jgi:hypothetical protein
VRRKALSHSLPSRQQPTAYPAIYYRDQGSHDSLVPSLSCIEPPFPIWLPLAARSRTVLPFFRNGALSLCWGLLSTVCTDIPSQRGCILSNRRFADRRAHQGLANQIGSAITGTCLRS